MRKFLLAAVMPLILATAARPEDITVFAAASLKSALDPVAAAWAATTGNTATLSYGGSSALAKQIEQGAPADVFLSAAVDWMDTLDHAALLAPGSRVDLWGNALSLIAHDQMTLPFALDTNTDLAGIIGSERLAMALVDAVPVGQYGKQALEHLGLWQSVLPQVVQTEDARATVTLVATGEAAFGVVYATDAKAAEAAGQAIEVSRFPTDSHRPIVYPGAVLAASTKSTAADFLTFLHSPPAAAIFAAQGFDILTK